MPTGSPVLAAAPHRVGTVSLVVRNLDLVARYYEDVIGLATIERTGQVARLGVGEDVLIELRGDPTARVRSQRDAGLFHTAFLLPSRAALGAWLGFVAARRIPIQGASDHAVSEAVYLADPEGNGIEVYADRPEPEWPRTADGLKLVTEAMDVDGVLEAGRSMRWEGFPQGGVVGHVHLQVGELPPADRFWHELLGFEIAARYPGASFYGSGGYHHQLAGNIWNSRGAPPRDDGGTGLAALELIVAGQDVIDATASRLTPAGVAHTVGNGRLETTDPWGTTVVLTTR
jgi:catechol 2,3-dioxygenase